jgi:hypothetical protein
MLGITKLKVPDTQIKPKLFVITLQKEDKQQRKFAVVHYDIGKAITQCWDYGSNYTINNYVTHIELSIDEINSKFKCFNP